MLLGATLDADAAVQVAGISGAALPGSRVVPQLAGSFGRTAVTHLEGGALLATGHRDGTVRLWDPTTGAPLATLVSSADGWAALLPDGSYKLSGDPGDLWWVAGLCRFEPRELDNLAQFVSSVRRLPDDAPIDDALIDHVR